MSSLLKDQYQSITSEVIVPAVGRLTDYSGDKKIDYEDITQRLAGYMQESVPLEELACLADCKEGKVQGEHWLERTITGSTKTR